MLNAPRAGIGGRPSSSGFVSPSLPSHLRPRPLLLNPYHALSLQNDCATFLYTSATLSDLPQMEELAR